jgi:predicted Zn-dependent peptidase
VVSLSYVNRAARLGEDYLPTYVADALRAGAYGEDRSVIYPLVLAGRAPAIWTNPSGTTITLSCRPEQLEDALDLLAAMVQRPMFDPTWLAPVRSRTMIDLLGLRDDYWDWWLARQHQGLAFDLSAEAIAEKVGQLDAAALERAHRELFRPEHSVMVAVGDVQASRVLSAVEQRFGAWQAAPRDSTPKVATAPRPGAPMPRTGRKITLMEEGGYTFITVLQDAPPPDSKDAVPFELLTEILSRSGESSLVRTLRFQHAHAYSVGASTVTIPDSGRYLMLRTAVAAETLVQDLNEILRALERHRTMRIDDKTLEGAKTLYGGHLARALSSVAGATHYLAQVELGATPALEDVQARLAATTPDEVQRVAQHYLHPEHATVVVMGGAFQAMDALRQLGEVSVE